MNLSLNMLISFGDARKNSSGKVKESATVKSNLDTWRHDKYYYYCLTFKGLSNLAVAAMGLVLEAFKRSFIPLDLFHSITTVGNQFANHRKRNWKFAVKWRNSPLSGKLFVTIGVHKHTCYHFSSLDLGALIPRTWHKPTVAVSKPSLCKKRCCVIHVRVDGLIYFYVISELFCCHLSQPRTPRQNMKWNKSNTFFLPSLWLVISLLVPRYWHLMNSEVLFNWDFTLFATSSISFQHKHNFSCWTSQFPQLWRTDCSNIH